MRALHIAAVAAGLVIGSAATAAASITPYAPTALTPEQRVEPGTSRLLDLRAADPAHGVAPWALRVSRSATGLQCTTVGQAVGGGFGLVGLDGRFREVPEANADACGDQALGARVFGAAKTRDVRTVLYGVAGPGLQRVTVALAGGERRMLRHTPEGGFLLALRGYPEDVQPVVTLQRGGATQRFAFADGGSVVPDPLGGRAWKLEAFAIGTTRGRPGCMLFRAARTVPGEATASSPPVCGHDRVKTLYFTTRRLSGNRSGGFPFGGDWNNHAPRTAVWGNARGHHRIVVRAPGAARVVAPKANGGFLVLFRASVKPPSISVEVDGRHYGHAFGIVRTPRAATAAAAQAAPIPISAQPDGRLPDGRFKPGYVQYRVHHARIAVRLPDPAGGPDWALNVFDAERLSLDSPSRTLAHARVIGRNRCAQLGRVQDGVFGWVYGDGRFRPDATGAEYGLLQCTGFKRPKLVGTMATTLNLTDPSAPKPTGAAVWGIAPGASAVNVAGTGGADGAAQVGGGAFLKLGDATSLPDDDARVEAGGKTLRLGPSNELPPFPPGFRLTFPTPIPGTERIEAPTPDPGGGPGLGLMVAQTREGVPCVGHPLELAGDRGGDVDLRLALLSGPVGLSRMLCRPLQTKPDAKRPCDIGWGGGNAEELEGKGAFLRRAQIERRLLAGRTQIQGQCSDDVDRITIRTPRDIRTLVPSALGHAFLAVYDGDFPAGHFEITAHLKSGRTWTLRENLGFL